MFKAILLLSLFGHLFGFLLETKTTNTTEGQTVSGTKYLTLDDKFQLLHDIEAVHKEQKDLIRLLTSQVQQRLLDMEKDIKEQEKTNETCASSEQFRELKQNNADLRMSLERLKKLHNESSADKIQMKTKINSLEQELENLKQLKNINQLQSLENIKQSINKVDTSVGLLMSHEQSRNQDFLALYNITTRTQSEFNNFKRQTVSDIKGGRQALENGLQNLTTLYHSTSAALQTQINENRKKVALTGCVTYNKDYSSGSVLGFPMMRTSDGIDHLSSFKFSGKFTCSSAGLYHVSVTITSKTNSAHYYIWKNGSMISRSYVSSNPRNELYSSTAVVATDLGIGDTIYVTIGISMYVYNTYSRITIVKLK